MKLHQAGITNVNTLRAKLNKSLFKNEQTYNQLNKFLKAPRVEYGRLRTEGGTYTDAVNFCKLLFGPAYSNGQGKVNLSTLVFSDEYQVNNNPLEMTVNGVKFVLSHAFLHLSNYKNLGAHAVCGFIYNGKQFYSDSNQRGYFLRANWTKKDDVDFFAEIGGGSTAAFRPALSMVFYIREDVSKFVPNMNSLVARRNLAAKYSKITSLLSKGATRKNSENAYKLLMSIPNKNNENYKYFKRHLDEKMNANAIKLLNSLQKTPNTSTASLRFFANLAKNVPHYQVVRNAAKKRLNAIQKT
jgi:hypothetical protein